MATDPVCLAREQSQGFRCISQAFCNAATLLGQTSAMLSAYPKPPLSGLSICLQSSTARQIRSVYTNPASQISVSIWGGGICPFDRLETVW